MASEESTGRRWFVGTVIAFIGAGAGLVAILQFVVEPRPAMSAFEVGIDRYGGKDYGGGSPAENVQACSDACLSDPQCQSYSFNVGAKQCWLKADRPLRVDNREFISGVKVLKPWWKLW